MPSNRAALLASYAAAPQLVADALASLPRDVIEFKPSPTAWSVHEIIIHLADAETHGFIRCRRAIAEPGSDVVAYDQDKWANAMAYASQDMDDALELFRLLCRTNHRLLSLLPEAAWARTIEHPENGTMTLDDWLVSYESHPREHVAQIKRNLAAWERQRSHP